LHDKLNDFTVSAKDFPGVSGTDYTVPINNAIVALAAAGGGRLEVPAGATISSQILITSSNIHLHFEGDCTATFTTKQCMFLFQGTVGTRLKNILVTGPSAMLDGGGTGIGGYTYSGADDAYATIRFEFVELLRMEMMRVTNGLVDNVQVYRCTDYVLDQVVASAPVHRHGVYVFGNIGAVPALGDPTTLGIGILSQLRCSTSPGMGILVEGTVGCNVNACYSAVNGTSADATILTGGFGYIRNPDTVNYPVATWKYFGTIEGCKSVQ